MKILHIQTRDYDKYFPKRDICCYILYKSQVFFRKISFEIKENLTWEEILQLDGARWEWNDLSNVKKVYLGVSGSGNEHYLFKREELEKEFLISIDNYIREQKINRIIKTN